MCVCVYGTCVCVSVGLVYVWGGLVCVGERDLCMCVGGPHRPFSGHTALMRSPIFHLCVAVRFAADEGLGAGASSNRSNVSFFTS